MTDSTPKHPQPSDAEIEREIRASRKSSLADAIGRSAAGLLKGTSPVTRKQQAEAEIESLLEHYLHDTEGALAIVLLRDVGGSAVLLESYDDPTAALRRVAESLLGSPEKLRRLVRRADAEWGRISSSPRIRHGDAIAGPQDPYTLDGGATGRWNCSQRLPGGEASKKRGRPAALFGAGVVRLHPAEPSLALAVHPTRRSARSLPLPRPTALRSFRRNRNFIGRLAHASDPCGGLLPPKHPPKKGSLPMVCSTCQFGQPDRFPGSVSTESVKLPRERPTWETQGSRLERRGSCTGIQREAC